MFLSYGNAKDTKTVPKFPKFSKFLLLNPNFVFFASAMGQKTIGLKNIFKKNGFWVILGQIYDIF